jgi:uncharacterized protein (DUF1015 family)
MAEVQSFRGIRFCPEVVDKLENVVTPPYDVISDSEQEEYYARSEYNIIRLILAKESPSEEDDSKYARSAATFRDWLDKGVLMKDSARSIYVYRQDFSLSDKRTLSRTGFIALLKLEEFDKGIVRPHERTLSGPKEDRLKLMLACNANFSQVFTIYDGGNTGIPALLRSVCDRDPLVNITDDDEVRHLLWAITEPKEISVVVEGIAGKPVVIADGHHRYETALNYRNEMCRRYGSYRGDELFNYVMTMFVDMSEPGLVVLPTHRGIRGAEMTGAEILSKLQEHFECQKFDFSNAQEQVAQKDALLIQMNAAFDNAQTAFGFYCGDGAFYLLRLRSRDVLRDLLGDEEYAVYGNLDVMVLQHLILERVFDIDHGVLAAGGRVFYSHEAEEALSQVDKKQCDVVFLLNPTRISQLVEVTNQGRVMPQKSTFFYPKLLTGLVLNDLSS